MDDESNIRFTVYLVFGILAVIGYFIRNSMGKKAIEELKNYAQSKHYVFYPKPDTTIVKSMGIPSIYADSKICNYLEFPENDWYTVWSDCDRTVRTDKTTASSRSFLILFRFNTIKIPEFEMRDNQGLIDTISKAFSGKVVKLDSEFDSSYVLKGTFETQVKKFFTSKVKRAFLSMDQKHLASERNLNLSDFGNLLTGHFGKSNGVQFFGKDQKLFVFCSEKTSLAGRQNIYNLASDIAKTIVKEHSSLDFIGKEPSEEPKDELSQFLSAQENKFNSAAPINKKPVQFSQEEENTNNQIPQPQHDESFSQNNENPPLNDLDEKDNNLVKEQYTGNGLEEDVKPTDKLMWLSAMMIIDKDIHINELKKIVDYGLSVGLSKAEIEQIVTMAKNKPNDLLLKLKMSTLPKSEDLMRMLIRVAFADGKIAKEELEFIRFAAKKMNYQEDELKVLLEDEKEYFIR